MVSMVFDDPELPKLALKRLVKPSMPSYPRARTLESPNMKGPLSTRKQCARVSLVSSLGGPLQLLKTRTAHSWT